MTDESRTGVANVFPGMGPVSHSDVARFLVTDPGARRILERADTLAGYPVLDRWNAAEDDYSEPAQLGFFVTSLALARWADERLPGSPGLCAGPSFGGKAAAVWSGAVSVDDGIRITLGIARELTRWYVGPRATLVTRSFARTPPDSLDELRAEMAAEGRWTETTCRVDPDLAMVTLDEKDLERLDTGLRAHGGLPLYVMRPPLHSSTFTDLRERVEEAVLDGVGFSDPRVPIVDDHDGALVRSGDGVRRMLADLCDRTVDWPAVLATLREEGVGTVRVCGQDALFGRVAATTRAVDVTAVDVTFARTPRARGGRPERRRAATVSLTAPA